MLDRLVDFIINFLHLFRFWVVVEEGERNVLYHFGRPVRLLEPGFHFKWPLQIDYDRATSVREEMETITSIDVMTSDGVPVRVSGAFRFQIRPDRVIEWQVTLGDEGKMLYSAMRTAITETVIRHTKAEVFAEDELRVLRQEILGRLRTEMGRYGYKVFDFLWAERTAPKTYRLITGE